jgi:hypothetical protein
MERCEPRQLWRLKRRLINLIDEKEMETRKLGQNMKIKDSIEYVGVGVVV